MNESGENSKQIKFAVENLFVADPGKQHRQKTYQEKIPCLYATYVALLFCTREEYVTQSTLLFKISVDDLPHTL